MLHWFQCCKIGVSIKCMKIYMYMNIEHFISESFQTMMGRLRLCILEVNYHFPRWRNLYRYLEIGNSFSCPVSLFYTICFCWTLSHTNSVKVIWWLSTDFTSLHYFSYNQTPENQRHSASWITPSHNSLTVFEFDATWPWTPLPFVLLFKFRWYKL